MEYVSTVYVINSNKQFLMMHNKKQGAWLPPGGFVNDEEFIHACSIRETAEEIGPSIANSLNFIGNVTFANSELDYRTKMLPLPIFIVKQTLTNGKVVENFIYLAKTDIIDIEITEYNATWYSYEDIKTIDTFDNVRMQIEYIYNHLDEFKSFPHE